MMLPGPRLLLRAVLLLGAARCSPAAPDSEWSTVGTPEHSSMTQGLPAESRPHRPAKAWGKAAGTPAPPEDVAAGREGLMMGYYRLPSSELSPADPEELQNQIRDPSQTPTDLQRTGTKHSLELNRTWTDPPSEPSRTGSNPPSEPSKTGTDPPSEPNKIRTNPPSEPSRTGTDPPSQPNRTRTDPPSEPNRTGTNPPSKPDRSETDPASEPNRMQIDSTSEPNRTDSDPPPEPSRTTTESPPEPNRTKINHLSEPNRPESNYPSERNRTETNQSSEPNRTDHPLNTDIEITQTEDHLGPHIYYRSEPDWTEMYIGQTSSAAGSTQKSATQRHLNKRTPHMDTTDMSTIRGRDRTLLSISNGSNVADITEIPNTYPTNSTRGSENITEDSPTTAVRNTSSEVAVPATYPLQTPSYVVTTYPSPTSHHMPNSTSPFRSVPVTTTNTRGSSKATEVTPNNSSIDLWSSSPSDFSPIRSSSSGLTSATAATTSTATSSSPLGEVTSPSQQPPSHVSSSPSIPSTFIAAAHSSVSPSLTETSSNTETTRTPNPLTAMSSTLGALASSTSLPPFLNMDSTPGTETNKTLVSSISPTDQTSTAKITSTSFSSETPGVVTERRSRDEVIPATQELTTTLMPMEAETTMMSTEGTPGVTVGTQLIGTFNQTRDNTPSTTSTMPTPSPRDTVRLTEQGHSILTSEGTTQTDPNTMAPRLENTVSTKGKKTLPYPLPQRTTPTVKYAATTVLTPLRTTSTAAASPCSSSPCHNGGLCVDSRDLKSYTCDCPAAWSGDLCSTDVDECLSSPCPAPSTCLNTRGSFSCQCPIGFLLQKAAGCVLVRTFLGHIEIPWSFLDGSDMKDRRLHQIKEDIVRIMNSSFSTIPGYYQSIVSSDSSDNLIVQNHFSLESNVTMFDLSRSLQNYAKVCETSPERPTSCQLVVHLQHRIRVLSLCHIRNPGCDNATAVCADPAGVALCQCKPGYYKYSKTDHSCRACDDGYRLESGACVRCPFGLGGFNCSNPYQLITVIIAAGGGGLLLILVIALAVTCCRKNKHDISKLIFKSGDFQMSPYAEYPKTQRSSEWGRETIEMQENGSTKNLLQMTDIYYSPGLRNSEIERNGLYPYNGLPGSRHSCIYPGQYNPSFINEENRRRDYF
ncbi:hypothetical protein GDO78_021460 [Eleutherodactylus coqui]|uniref:EGF-like domain-containing protein n=2 Tax=Eleutherodactylus coqui TaxID=57060 RepID=A0A8J6EGW5_ELECQ|nr:hypothetical protein GDO78_021460 [Eleutherodactylus coqui]